MKLLIIISSYAHLHLLRYLYLLHYLWSGLVLSEDICFSLVVIVVVVPLVLYKIHVATNHLVLEGDNLRHWYIVNR